MNCLEFSRLKSELKRRNLNSIGTKLELIQRLQTFFSERKNSSQGHHTIENLSINESESSEEEYKPISKRRKTISSSSKTNIKKKKTSKPKEKKESKQETKEDSNLIQPTEELKESALTKTKSKKKKKKLMKKEVSSLLEKTVVHLRTELKQHGLSTVGKKEELVQRIVDYLEQN